MIKFPSGNLRYTLTSYGGSPKQTVLGLRNLNEYWVNSTNFSKQHSSTSEPRMNVPASRNGGAQCYSIAFLLYLNTTWSDMIPWLYTSESNLQRLSAKFVWAGQAQAGPNEHCRKKLYVRDPPPSGPVRICMPLGVPNDDRRC